MVDQRGFDGVGRTASWRGPPGLIGVRPTPETSTKCRRFIDTPAAGVEKVSSEEYMAAWSLIWWDGPAVVLGACPPPLLGNFSRPSIPPTMGNR
jgi:hypothetical protein